MEATVEILVTVGCTLLTALKSANEESYTMSYLTGSAPAYSAPFSLSTTTLISKTGTCDL